MSVLSAQSIRRRCEGARPLIKPFAERGVFDGKSFGLSSASYDVRTSQTIWHWPFWWRLASTIEHFNIPNHICAFVKDKSSNARKFILVQNTFIDCGWSGYLTIEITRMLPWPVRIKAGTPIAQIVFQFLDERTCLPYKGRYQNQKNGPQAAILATRENVG